MSLLKTLFNSFLSYTPLALSQLLYCLTIPVTFFFFNKSWHFLINSSLFFLHFVPLVFLRLYPIKVILALFGDQYTRINQ